MTLQDVIFSGSLKVQVPNFTLSASKIVKEYTKKHIHLFSLFTFFSFRFLRRLKPYTLLACKMFCLVANKIILLFFIVIYEPA